MSLREWIRGRARHVAIVFAGALLCAVVTALPAAAMTEHCMLDGDDVRGTFFNAPTKDTKPVRIVMAGRTYSIPRNYFRYPQAECRTGETRGILLRMTLPDFLPSTDETWDELYGKVLNKDANDIQVSVSQQTLKDMTRLMENHSRSEVEGRSVPPVDGLSSLAQGPLAPDGRHSWDVYYAPSRERPEIVIYCNPIREGYGSICKLLFPHNGLTWDPSVQRRHLPRWREIIAGLRAKIDSFIVKERLNLISGSER